MNAAIITALCTGIPAVITAVTALVSAFRTKSAVSAHIQDHPTEGTKP